MKTLRRAVFIVALIMCVGRAGAQGRYSDARLRGVMSSLMRRGIVRLRQVSTPGQSFRFDSARALVDVLSRCVGDSPVGGPPGVTPEEAETLFELVGELNYELEANGDSYAWYLALSDGLRRDTADIKRRLSDCLRGPRLGDSPPIGISPVAIYGMAEGALAPPRIQLVPPQRSSLGDRVRTDLVYATTPAAASQYRMCTRLPGLRLD